MDAGTTSAGTESGNTTSAGTESGITSAGDASATGSTADSGSDDAASVCGDAVAVLPEQCDDGNLEPGDGCAADCTLEVMTVGFEESPDPIPNPERGFFHSNYLAPGESIDLGETSTDGDTVLKVNFELGSFRQQPDIGPVVDTVVNALNDARAAGIKLWPRFRYNDGTGCPFAWEGQEPDPTSYTCDTDLATMLAHVDALTPALLAGQDVIVALDAGFIGAWAEWHSSDHFAEEADGGDYPQRRMLVDALLAALPERHVLVRAPTYKLGMYTDDPLPADPLSHALNRGSAFDPAEPRARIGHLNDCFLSTDNDMGTYPSENLEAWKDFVAKETRFVPMGGETCPIGSDNGVPVVSEQSHCDPPATEGGRAVAELSRLHWSLLHREWVPQILENWIAEGCYPEIDRRLGYRLVVHDASFNPAAAPGGLLVLRVDLENVGFAAPFNPRPVRVVLDGPARLVADLSSVDPRRLEPSRPSSIEALLRIPADAPAGEYRLALWLPDASPAIADDPSYAIQLASTNDGTPTWDATSGTNTLSSNFTVSPDAPGTLDPDATTFSEL